MDICNFTSLQKSLKKCIRVEMLLLVLFLIGLFMILRNDQEDCDC